MSDSPHSVVAPSRAARRFAAAVVVLYALITLVPLAWIVLTSFKSPSDAISYPPKLLFQPTLEGYVNLFTTRSRQAPSGSKPADCRNARVPSASASTQVTTEASSTPPPVPARSVSMAALRRREP